MDMTIINHNHASNLDPVRKENEVVIERRGLQKEGLAKEQEQRQEEKGQEKAKEDKQPEKPQEFWPGRVQNGELYCLCEGDHKAMCFTVKFSWANKGKKYWRCRKGETERCSLYIWDTDYPTAKAWLAEHGPPPPLEPQTPQGKAKEAAIRSAQNPWTLAKSSKRKAKSISRDVSDEDGSGRMIVVTPDTESGESGMGIRDPESPSRKTRKRSRQDTPGRCGGKTISEHAAQTAADTLPTPSTTTSKHPPQALPHPNQHPHPPNPLNLREIAAASVRLASVIDLTHDPKEKPPKVKEPRPEPEPKTEQEPDTTSPLTTSILDELKSAKIHLKGSTITYIAHLIDTEMELHETRMRRARITMERMRKKLDEMESALVAVAGMEDGDALELSD